MEKNRIGQNAGIIWQELDSNGEMSVSELIKSTKLDKNNFYLALGWLARENKVFLNNTGTELTLSIIY